MSWCAKGWSYGRIATRPNNRTTTPVYDHVCVQSANRMSTPQVWLCAPAQLSVDGFIDPSPATSATDRKFDSSSGGAARRTTVQMIRGCGGQYRKGVRARRVTRVQRVAAKQARLTGGSETSWAREGVAIPTENHPLGRLRCILITVQTDRGTGVLRYDHTNRHMHDGTSRQ